MTILTVFQAFHVSFIDDNFNCAYISMIARYTKIWFIHSSKLHLSDLIDLDDRMLT